ncbi:phage tail protein [Sphingomonas sp.]|uniref:phage tail protein n=1 Tax=Sphingomonas sp. TaxID=28214 RepID=UPI00307F90D7
MATLVLSTVGGLFGPVGSLIGALAGQVIDRELLFKPKGREGPRLTELSVQTSSYGTPVPKLFGTLRVAGTVIWASDLVEQRHRDGGKGQPTVTRYSYSASFAVALSARPIHAIGRIWADGKLLRGAAGDWKERTGFRLHLGGEDQPPDPLIASAEGLALTPAHRGIAYAVFEGLELEAFGNRIPSLSFEVIADAGPVPAGQIVEAVSGGAIGAGDATRPIGGYSAYGETLRGAVAPLIDAAGCWPAIAAGRLRLVGGVGAATAVADPDAGAGAARTIDAADRVPQRVAISHYDPARDYQLGVQVATSPSGAAGERRIALPAALPASDAKAIAADELLRAAAGRTRRSLRPGWAGLAIAPGSRVTVAGEAGLWRVAETTLDVDGVALTLIPIAGPAATRPASPGRVHPAPDRRRGATILSVFELPDISDPSGDRARIAIAAGGSTAGWRSAALAVSSDAGARWEPVGTTAAPAVIGRVYLPPTAASALIEDRRSQLVVDLDTDPGVLNDATSAALDTGANLAMIGDELIQFARAEPLGAGRWLLTHLWRGRRGTEDRIGRVVAGDRFVLIEPAAVALVPVVGGAGTRLTVMATGVGDAEPVEADVTLTGRLAAPLAPVALTVRPGDGGRWVHWTRRSRAGWDWLDGTDAPLGESAERYQIRVTDPAGASFEAISTAPHWFLEGSGAARLEVRQAGDRGLSPPATLTLDPME